MKLIFKKTEDSFCFECGDYIPKEKVEYMVIATKRDGVKEIIFDEETLKAIDEEIDIKALCKPCAERIKYELEEVFREVVRLREILEEWDDDRR